MVVLFLEERAEVNKKEKRSRVKGREGQGRVKGQSADRRKGVTPLAPFSAAGKGGNEGKLT
jgi:hypothetical protein